MPRRLKPNLGTQVTELQLKAERDALELRQSRRMIEVLINAQTKGDVEMAHTAMEDMRRWINE